MDTLRFRHSLQVDVIDDQRLFLLNDEQAIIVENPDTARVAAQIDGRRSVAEIMSQLAHALPPDRVFLEVAKLQKAGHVVADGVEATPARSYIESWGRATDRYTQVTHQFTVAVVDWAGADFATALAGAFDGYGGRVVVEAAEGAGPVADADVLVVVVTDYLDERLRVLNAQLRDAGQQWLLVKPCGRQVWVGPRFVPEETGCWESLADRLAANRQVERYVASKNGGGLPRVKPSGTAPGAVGLAAGLVAGELFTLSAGIDGRLGGEMVSLDLRTHESARHTLVRQPQLEVDDPSSLRRTDDVVLTDAPAQHLEDGGYRVCTPQETFDRLQHHISPVLGAVSRLETLNVDEEGITYSFVAGHNFGMMGDNMDLLRTNMRGQSGGKGRTEIQAKVSGVCEALERYSGVWTPDVPELLSSWNALEQRAIHPEAYQLFSDAQYAMREEWNTDPRHRLQRIPHRFDPDRPIHFTRGRSLTTGEQVLVPSAMIWFGHPDLAQTDHIYTMTDSNGGAAGNTVDEAVLQGLCEVYERDAVALWWFNRVARPAVDLETVADPYVTRMREFYATMDRDIWVLDLSNDLKVHTFAAFSRRDHEVEDLMVGFGAHPDPEIAFFRALTELNQFLPFVRRRDDDGSTVYGVEDPATLEWCKTRTIESDPWVAPDPAAPKVRLSDLSKPLPGTLGGVVDYCVRDLEQAGIETVVINQTRPDIELSVVKVFAPGMRHFWRRTGPGRLYDVPVKLGWLDRARTEEELNPIGVFF